MSRSGGTGRRCRNHFTSQGERYANNPELDSFTSSSSLGCQFNRKCMPLKFSRAKGGEYYAPDKSRDPVGKQVSPLKLLSDDSSPSRAPYRDVSKPALKSTLSVIPSSDSELGSRENRHRHRHDREEARRKKHTDFETGRKKESHQQTKSSEDKKPSSPERRSSKQVRIATPEKHDTSDDPLLHRKKSQEKPDVPAGRQRGGAESLKDSPSWETTFDDN
ncbi:GD15133 [Drosophila simulans]|uniref:GD15133 n=1 Tax=Drosophila simulans TaxID=7240 RepID=B4NT70_DROSI|nr:GD15133 [Drosophila simulans]